MLPGNEQTDYAGGDSRRIDGDEESYGQWTVPSFGSAADGVTPPRVEGGEVTHLHEPVGGPRHESLW